MRDALLARGARVGVVEALMLERRRAARGAPRRRRRRAPGARCPTPARSLMFARTPFAVDRLLALGVPADLRDRWGTSPIEAFSRLGARGTAAGRDARRAGRRRRRPTSTPASAISRRSKPPARAGAGRGPATTPCSWPRSTPGSTTWCPGCWRTGRPPNARAAAQSRQTALHSAAWNGDLRMVDILLVEAGADLARRATREHDSTPRGWAETSLQITRNPDAGVVARHLADLGG